MRREGKSEVTDFAVGEATTLSVGGQKLFSSPGLKVTAAGEPGQVKTDDGGEWRATESQRGMP